MYVVRCVFYLSMSSVVDVFWESTQVFFAAYHPRGSESQEQPWLVMITATVSQFIHSKFLIPFLDFEWTHFNEFARTMIVLNY